MVGGGRLTSKIGGRLRPLPSHPPPIDAVSPLWKLCLIIVIVKHYENMREICRETVTFNAQQ